VCLAALLSAPVVFADSDLEKAEIFNHCNKRAKVDTKVSARELCFDLRVGEVIWCGYADVLVLVMCSLGGG
jgi:hypothetical protein